MDLIIQIVIFVVPLALATYLSLKESITISAKIVVWSICLIISLIGAGWIIYGKPCTVHAKMQPGGIRNFLFLKDKRWLTKHAFEFNIERYKGDRMMYRTFEAIYDNGKITPMSEEMNIQKARVLVTVVEDIEKTEKPGIRFRDIIKYKGALKSFPDGLQYQKKLRDEW